MPPVTRALVKAALCWLVGGFVLLGLVAAAPLHPAAARFAPWNPAALHAIVVGFATQVIFGVALWLFPRSPHVPPPVLGWLLVVALNLGLLLRAVAEPLVVETRHAAAGLALILAAGLQLLAAIAFVALAWPRVRTR